MKNQIKSNPQTTIKTKLVNNNIDNSNSPNCKTFLSSIIIFFKKLYILYIIILFLSIK